MRYQHDERCPMPTENEQSDLTGKRVAATVAIIVAAMLLSLFLSVAYGQTVSRQATIRWTAPTLCVSGAAIATCPVSGYIVQKLINSTWTQVGTTPASATSFTHTGLGLGNHVYRVIAASTTTNDSNPSNEAGKLEDAPAPVVITVTITVITSP